MAKNIFFLANVIPPDQWSQKYIKTNLGDTCIFWRNKENSGTPLTPFCYYNFFVKYILFDTLICFF